MWEIEGNENGASNNVMMEMSLNQHGAQKQAVSELERTIDEHLDGTYVVKCVSYHSSLRW